MAMYNQMGSPMPDFVPVVRGETGKVAAVKAVTRKMVQFDPKRRCTMTQVVKDITALGGMTATRNSCVYFYFSHFLRNFSLSLTFVAYYLRQY